MTKPQVMAWIRKTRIVPVVRAPSSDLAIEAVEALLEGGIDVIEMTMTVPNAVEAIHEVSKRFGSSALIGAGTVLDPETAKKCVAAGAQFIVSPGTDIETVAWCGSQNVTVVPGALTPTEVLTAWRAGADIVKVFPCDSMGGASYVKSLKAPLPDIPLLPTGGVTLENLRSFLNAGAHAVGVGGNLVDIQHLTAGRRNVLVERAKQFLAIARSS